MNLWSARGDAARDLDGPLSDYRVFFEDVFNASNILIEEFNLCGAESGMPRVAGVTTAKGFAILHCCYSLSLDAHSQETGALLRIVIETFEALQYLRLAPSRVEKVEMEGFPKAGEIAKAISGDFKHVRDFLNQKSSHMSLSTHAIGHLELPEKGKIATHHRHEIEVLRRNLQVLAMFGAYLCIESHACLFQCDKVRAQTVGLVIAELKQRAVKFNEAS